MNQRSGNSSILQPQLCILLVAGRLISSATSTDLHVPQSHSYHIYRFTVLHGTWTSTLLHLKLVFTHWSSAFGTVILVIS